MTVTSMQLFPKDFFKRFSLGKLSQSPKILSQDCQENNQTSSEIITSTLPPMRRRLPPMASPYIDRIDDLVEAAYQRRFNDLKLAAAKKKKKEETSRRIGSDNFLPGIFNSIVGASGGLSSGSSGGGHPSPTYGEPQPMFNILDFKKAIVNTLIQALKAITGGVIGIAGKVVKTGGFVVLTKGRFISSTGDAISSFGAQLTRGALITAPKHHHQSYGPPRYTYNQPQHIEGASFNDRLPTMNEVYSEHHNYHPGN